MIQNMDGLQILCLITAIALGASAFPAADEIANLPGLSEKPTFKQYSGYLNATGPRRLHYWLVLSQDKPETDPLLLWLNGGPGCSSMEGLLNENGPFSLSSDGKTLTPNPYSWNKVANVLYVEAPVGVGYSYTTETSVQYSDDMAAEDNYLALKSFFKMYPELKHNDFYITGESYAGIYVPTLAMRVMVDSEINFMGTATGNGFNDAALNGNSLLYFAYYHGLIEHRTYNKMLTSCQCKNTSLGWCDFQGQGQIYTECGSIVNSVFGKIYNHGLNVYNLYQDCYQKSKWLSVVENGLVTKTRVSKSSTKYLLNPTLTLAPACVNAQSLLKYLNDGAVKKALHIPDGLPSWDICSDKVSLKYHRQYSSTAPFYRKLLQAKKYKLLIYNGDVDMACNFLGDEWFTESLGQKMLSDYRAWHVNKDDGPQVAGYIKEYDGISFITIRGSGHMVPQDKPQEAFLMLKSFLGLAAI